MRDGSAEISEQLPTTRHICVWNIGWVITLSILSLSTLYGLDKKRVELACLVWEYVGTNFPSSLSEDNITIVTSHLTSSASSPIKNSEKTSGYHVNELNLSLYSGVPCNKRGDALDHQAKGHYEATPENIYKAYILRIPF